MIGLSPSLAGGENDTVAWALPAVAVTLVGALGTVAGAVGVTLLDGVDAGPCPIAFVARTVNV